MEQIYYTQCPLGYGMGIGNGFQIKRISAGYPQAADFRHLNMKPLLPGSRTLAPRALRYRRDQDVAEIAWLAPRPLEYVTERGPWGRPGGLFAHGLRLPIAELGPISQWPAGLFGSSIWRDEDREPTRGQPPTALELGPEALAVPAETASLCSLARRLAVADAFLASLLTASARTVSEGRTLFLIAEADQLPTWIQALSLAFPAPLRLDLTFSTYHDRPEELHGFRIQGTIPQVRPNRMALRPIGYVADVAAAAIDPPIEPDAWARKLTSAIRQGRTDDLAAWQRWGERAAPEVPAAERFSANWLDALTRSHEAMTDSAPTPTDADAWQGLLESSRWAVASKLDRPWLERHPATWWIQALPSDLDRPAIEAFIFQEGLVRKNPELAQPIDWGRAAALWLRRLPPDTRHKVVRRFLRAWTGSDKTAFANALLTNLDPDRARPTLDRLRQEPEFDPVLLLPLEAREAVATLAGQGDHQPITTILQRGLDRPEHLAGLLDVIDDALESRNRSIRSTAADVLAGSLERATDGGIAEALRWALPKGDTGERWLRPYLRARFSDPDQSAEWERIARLTPSKLRAALARAVLPLALGNGMPDASLRWAVEKLLLTLDKGQRASVDNPRWPDEYLARVSFLDLVQLRHSKQKRDPELLDWIDTAQRRGNLDRENLAKLEHGDQYARGLKARDAGWLLNNNLPDVPPADRRTLLEQVLQNLGSASIEQLDLCLDSCRRSWPGAFSAGAEGLADLAVPLARVLLPDRGDPHHWFEQFQHLLGRLLDDAEARGFGPGSLGAFIVAVTVRSAGPDPTDFSPWPLRKFLIQHDDAWRILAQDARQDLVGDNPTADSARDRAQAEGPSARVCRGWERQLERLAAFARPVVGARFFELMLNAGTPASLVSIAIDRVADLASQPLLRDLPWWAGTGGDDDIREGFCQLVPIAPLPLDALPSLRTWLGMPRPIDASLPEAAPIAPAADLDDFPFVPLDDEPVYEVGGESGIRLSPRARARWYCLHALSVFARPGQNEGDRWRELLGLVKKKTAPIDWLERDEPYQWVAWLIEKTQVYEAVNVPQLANELVRQGIRDVSRISAWPSDLNGLVPSLAAINGMRVGLREFLGELRRELEGRLKDDRESGPTRRRS